MSTCDCAEDWTCREHRMPPIVFKHYGGVARQDRIGTPAMCDKAWHTGNPVPAVSVFRCAECPRVYARCEQCERMNKASGDMRSHFWTCHRYSKTTRKKVVPNE